MTSLFFAALAGLVTITSPCVIPILPIILASALKKNPWFPVMMVLGLSTVFSFLGVLFGAFGSALPFSSSALNSAAIALMLLMGLSIVLDGVGNTLSQWLSPIMSRCARMHGGEDPSMIHGFFLGTLLGVVWAPCAGPILASILTLAASSKSLLKGFLLLFTYSVGAGIPMLIIAYGGHRFLRGRQFLTRHSAHIKKAFGWVLIATALLLYFGIFKKVEAAILPYSPDFISRF